MSKRVAALGAQVVGVGCVAGSLWVWWRPEAGVLAFGVALLVGGALNEGDG